MKALVIPTLICAVLAGASAAEEIEPARLTDLPRADIVILGEVHDNAVHHANQARAIAALRPVALVWEMLTEAQAHAMPDDRSDAAVVAQVLGWEGTGWPDFALYHPLILAAPQARHLGAAVPRAEARRAFAEGAAGVFGAQAEQFDLTRALPAVEQAAREAEQYEAHCQALPLDMMQGMVEAQRLRDAALARSALEALRDTGGPVVIITGNGHARSDWGVPSVLARAAPGATVLSVGQIEAGTGQEGPQPWDLWLVTDPQPRPDPCEAFR